MTKGDDAADVDVDALRRIDVDVAEDNDDSHGYLRAVHLGLAHIEVDVSEGSYGKGPSLQPPAAASHDMTEQSRGETGRSAPVAQLLRRSIR